MRSRSRVVARALAVAATLALVALPAFGWGHTGHAMINKLAVDALPAGPLKNFFEKSRDYISEHAVDPDLVKKEHHAQEAPKHFLNIDADSSVKPEDYPKTWQAVVDRFGKQAALKQGKVPWAIEETTQELIEAFKAKDGTRIIEKATWLGHYVGDAHQPFHSCANYDGQLTGQKGIHAIFEQKMIEHHQDECEKEAQKLIATMQVGEIEGLISLKALTWIVEGDKQAHKILELDKGNRASGREKALWKATGAMAEKRIAEAAVQLASLWVTAYKRAKQPDLPGEVALPKGETVQPGGDEADERAGAGDTPKESPKPDATKPEVKPDAAPKPTEPVNNGSVKGPFAGFMVRDDDGQPGAVIDSVEASSTVASAGILANDVIIAVDGASVSGVSSLGKRCQGLHSGDKVPFTILRAGAEHTFSVSIP